MRFRRHRGLRRSREPLYWSRSAVCSAFGHAASYTSPTNCEGSTVLQVEELINGSFLDVGSVDAGLSTRRLKYNNQLSWTMTSLSTPHRFYIWCVIAKTSQNLISGYATTPATLGDLLNGGGGNFTSSLDILAFESTIVSTAEFLAGNNSMFGVEGGSFWTDPHGKFNFDIKSKRRLQSDETIAAFWGTDLVEAVTSLPSASSWTVNKFTVFSRLYSALRRR